jgi:hypothetical protein
MAQQTDISKMETTQTAVEWLLHQLNTRKKPLDNSQIDKLFEIAKQIEKEQIIDAYWNGTTDTEKQDALIEAEHFYNEYYYKPQ